MYQTKVTPYQHQTDALKQMHGKRAFALLMAMRTGKTKVLLDDFGVMELTGQVSDLLVIAPAGVYRTWIKAMQDHLSDDLRSRVHIFTWASATAETKSVTLARDAFLSVTDVPRVLLMNVEALSMVKLAKATCVKFLRNPAKAMIAVDESTIIKSHRAKRTKFINQILAPRAAFRRILSGLATPRSPLDLFCQFEFLNPSILGYSSFTLFRARYAIMREMSYGGRRVPIVVDYRYLDELKRNIEPHSFRVEFRPKIPSTYTIREVKLPAEQKRLYDEIKHYATTQLNNGAHVTATIVISQILRLHQVLCGNVKDEAGQEHEIPERRTSELLELLDDYAGKAIIWCSYDHSVKKVARALAQEYDPACTVIDEWGKEKRIEPQFPNKAVARFWGGNEATREAEEYEFLNSDACRFMVATPAAGGRGRTWSNADLVIYYSSTNNLEHRDQSEQRAQGLEKERQVDYIDLIAPGTIETRILHALRNKIDMASIINGDNYKEWLI